MTSLVQTVFFQTRRFPSSGSWERWWTVVIVRSVFTLFIVPGRRFVTAGASRLRNEDFWCRAFHVNLAATASLGRHRRTGNPRAHSFWCNIFYVSQTTSPHYLFSMHLFIIFCQHLIYPIFICAPLPITVHIMCPPPKISSDCLLVISSKTPTAHHIPTIRYHGA